MAQKKKRRGSRELRAPIGFDRTSIYSANGQQSRKKQAHDTERKLEAERAERRAAAPPELVASHALCDRIDRERTQKKKRGNPMRGVRIGELDRLFTERYGGDCVMNWQFPDDCAGRDDALIFVAVRLSFGQSIAAAAREVMHYAPWLNAEDAAALAAIAASEREQKKLKAEALGERLNLRDETRTRLGIRTIAPVDMSREERKARTRARDAEQKRMKRAEKRAAAIASAPPKKKPWEEAGLSRSAYYRHRSKVGPKSVGHISVDIYERRETVPRAVRPRSRKPYVIPANIALH